MQLNFDNKLKDYVNSFNAQDEEIYPQVVDNAHALEFLQSQIPLLDCPDPILERTYYFRWWTLRKHWKQTPNGHILSEFLPEVFWAGPCNSINCAVGHHLREARWLKDTAGWTKEYIRFWLEGKGNALNYSMWLCSAIEDYLSLHPDPAFEKECLQGMIDLYQKWEDKSLQPCGLFWSNDGKDGMEFSISGSGIRPTLNSYMYGDAKTIARLARRVGDNPTALQFEAKAERIKVLMNHLLWDGDFYRTIPCEKGAPLLQNQRPTVHPDHRVRELVGYIPWYFDIPEADKDKAFLCLTDPQGFAAPHGLTTAEQRHPRFMFEHEHECLWNGCVWPFATSQTLTAVANLLHSRENPPLTREDYYRMLVQYAQSHTLLKEDGKRVDWIDEDMDPFNGEWIARNELKADHWNPKRGGYERGKDYNHSTFCDLVLSGLLGIRMEGGQPTVSPLIPETWDYFCVKNLMADNWTILFDRTGEHYGLGKGLQIFKEA